MDLLIEPDSTISTTDMVASSVTRRPSRNSGCTSSLSSILLIWGPPPWTTIGFRPHTFSITMSRANCCASFGSTMAWPPYFTTMIWSS